MAEYSDIPALYKDGKWSSSNVSAENANLSNVVLASADLLPYDLKHPANAPTSPSNPSFTLYQQKLRKLKLKRLFIQLVHSTNE